LRSTSKKPPQLAGAFLDFVDLRACLGSDHGKWENENLNVLRRGGARTDLFKSRARRTPRRPRGLEAAGAVYAAKCESLLSIRAESPCYNGAARCRGARRGIVFARRSSQGAFEIPMKTKTLVSVFAAVLVTSAASYLVAAEMKPAASDMPATASPMMGPLYTVTCDPKCDFGVHGHDKQEVIDIIIQHAKKHHNMDVKAADVEKMIVVTDGPAPKM
jgi:predicted small metal-binding protein